MPSLVEAAVAAHAAGDERLGHRVVGQQLGLGEGDLVGGHRVPPVLGWRQLYTPRCTPARRREVTWSRSRPSGCSGGRSGRRRSCTAPRRPSPGPGFAATSMEDVAEACGVTKLIVYRHFDSKEDLYRAILQRVFDRQAEELAPRARAPVAVRAGRPHAAHRRPRGPGRLHAAVAPRAPRGAVRRLRPRAAGHVGAGGARPHGDRQRRPALRRVERRGRHRLARGGRARVARGRRRGPRRRHGPVGHRGPAAHAGRLGRRRRSRSRPSGLP